jgi:hypothetical protein
MSIVLVIAQALLALYFFILVLGTPSMRYRHGLLTKMLWLLSSPLVIIPYLGFLVLIGYVVARNVWQTEDTYTRFPAGPGPSAPTGHATGSTMSAPTRRSCGTCGGSGLYGYCGQCQGGWVKGYNGALESCHAGCNYGRTRCGNCGGSGKVTAY